MNAFYSALVLSLVAAEPPSVERPSVLVVEGYRLVEGTVKEIPDFHDATGETKLVRVTSGGVTRTWPAKDVLFLGTTRQEAYTFVKGKWQPTTVDDRIKMAEWCRDAGLAAEALAEAKAAAAMAPPDAFLVKLIRDLEAAKAKAPEDRAIRIVRAAPSKPAPLSSVVPITAREKPVVDSAAEKYFGLKVQPILMNQCVSCHADPKKGGAFQLGRTPAGESAGAVTTRNLAATVKQVSGDKPDRSPLLVYAVRPHGGQQQAALTIHHPAYQHLAGWVASVAPQLPQTPATPKAVTFAATAGSNPLPSPPPLQVPPVKPGPGKVTVTAGPPVADAFDPAEFNKSAGPAKKQ